MFVRKCSDIEHSADTAEGSPAEHSADIAEDNPAEHSVRTAEDNPAEHSADTAEDNPAEHSADTAEDNPAEHSVRTAEYSADRKADRDYTAARPEAAPLIFPFAPLYLPLAELLTTNAIMPSRPATPK